MSKTEALQEAINEGIKKIESFNEDDRLKVHKIYSDIFKIYSSLSREDFADDYHYNLHLKFLLESSIPFKTEMENLLDKNYSGVDLENNFYQIKMSLIEMLPSKIIK